MAKVASEKIRTISAEIMKDVATNLPVDGFRLSPSIINKDFTVVNVLHGEYNKKPTVTLVLSNDEQTFNLSLSILKRARLMTSSKVKVNKFFNKNENVVLRSNADAIIAGSTYFHNESKMTSADNFTVPKTLHIEYAVIREDREGKPAVNPFLYEGFRLVVDAAPEGKFPTMDDFRAELAKTGTDRIAGLPEGKEPKLFSYVKEDDIATYGYILVMKDTLEREE